MFIPIFNFAWGFVTWPKLIKGLQRWQRSQGKEVTDLSGLSIGFAIVFILMWILGWVLGLSILISVIDLTVFIIFYGRLKSAINEMLD